MNLCLQSRSRSWIRNAVRAWEFAGRNRYACLHKMTNPVQSHSNKVLLRSLEQGEFIDQFCLAPRILADANSVFCVIL